MTQQAKYITVEYTPNETELYSRDGVTIYDEGIHEYEDVLNTELSWLEDGNDTHEIHIFKLHKIIRPKKVVRELTVLDPEDDVVVVKDTKEPVIEI